MMMGKKIGGASLAGISFFFLLSTASAKPFDGDRMENRMEKIQEQLNLTTDQKQKLKEHRQSHRGGNKELREQIEAKHKALAEELEKPELNMDRIKQIHSELKDLNIKMEDHRLEGILEVRKIMTPEQFKKFHELMHKDHKPGQMGKGGHDRDHDEDKP